MPRKLDVPEENPGTRRQVGCFSAPPPLCLGEPYNDKRIIDGRSKGKSLQSGLYRSDERTRLCAPGTFRLSPFLFTNIDMKGKEPYKENIRYKDRFSNGDVRPKGAPKCGFQSADFPKRDEYTNTIRTEQLREVLRRENRLNTANSKTAEERMKTAGIRPQSAVVSTVMCPLILPSTNFQYDNHLADPSLRPSDVQGGMRKIPLYDLVSRIPEQSLRLKRDDRQGKYFFMAERQKQEAEMAGTYRESKQKIIEGHAWVSVALPNGNQMQV